MNSKTLETQSMIDPTTPAVAVEKITAEQFALWTYNLLTDLRDVRQLTMSEQEIRDTAVIFLP